MDCDWERLGMATAGGEDRESADGGNAGHPVVTDRIRCAKTKFRRRVALAIHILNMRFLGHGEFESVYSRQVWDIEGPSRFGSRPFG